MITVVLRVHPQFPGGYALEELYATPKNALKGKSAR